MASEFDDKPPRALAAIKQAVKASWGKTTLDGVLEEGDLFADLIATDDQALKMMEHYVSNGHSFKKNLEELVSGSVDESRAEFFAKCLFFRLLTKANSCI